MSRREAIQDRTAHKIYRGVALLNGVTIKGEKYIKRDDALDQCDRFISAANPAPVTATREQASRDSNHDAGSEATSRFLPVDHHNPDAPLPFGIKDTVGDYSVWLASPVARDSELESLTELVARSQRIEEAARNFLAIVNGTDAKWKSEPEFKALAAALQQEQA